MLVFTGVNTYSIPAWFIEQNRSGLKSSQAAEVSGVNVLLGCLAHHRKEANLRICKNKDLGTCLFLEVKDKSLADMKGVEVIGCQ